MALIYIRTDTVWFQDYPPDSLLLLRGPVRFKGSRTVSGALPPLLMAYGEEAVEGLTRSNLKGYFYSSGNRL